MKTTRAVRMPETISNLIRLTDKENPKPEDLERLRKRLDENDYLVRINEVSEFALESVIENVTSSALMKELYDRQIAEKRKALDYDSESVMVRMLINHVILCHFRLNTFEALHTKKFRESHSIKAGLYWDRLLSTYQRRFQKACESLAKVKRLLSEAELRNQQIKNQKSQGTLNATRLYTALGG